MSYLFEPATMLPPLHVRYIDMTVAEFLAYNRAFELITENERTY